MHECKFRKGDRVQLIDKEPVLYRFRGAVGTVIGTACDADGYIAVWYDRFGKYQSDPATLLLVDDGVDAT